MPDFSRHVQLRVIRQIFTVHGEMVTFIFFLPIFAGIHILLLKLAFRERLDANAGGEIICFRRLHALYSLKISHRSRLRYFVL
jgi:hypothetical protein